MDPSRIIRFEKTPMHADTPAKKLVARRKRRERVYNRAGEPSVTFCGKEEQRRERALIFIKSRSKRYKACSDVVPVAGLEPARCRHRWILSYLLHTEYKRTQPPMEVVDGHQKARNY